METAYILIAAAVYLAGCYRLLCIAFSKHVLWGIGCLLVPVVALVFVFKYWEEAKKPVAIYLIALALIVLGNLTFAG